MENITATQARMAGINHALIHSNHPVECFGMFSSFSQMQHSGWEFVVEQILDYRATQIYGKHKQANLYIMTDRYNNDYMHDMFQLGYEQGRNRQMDRMRGHAMSFRVRHIASDIRITVHDGYKMGNLYRMGSGESIVNMCDYNLQELGIFPREEIAKELIVPEMEVTDLLDNIINKQSAAKRERAEKALRNGARSSTAKIILLKDAI